jgi:hypothetical protein
MELLSRRRATSVVHARVARSTLKRTSGSASSLKPCAASIGSDYLTDAATGAGDIKPDAREPVMAELRRTSRPSSSTASTTWCCSRPSQSRRSNASSSSCSTTCGAAAFLGGDVHDGAEIVDMRDGELVVTCQNPVASVA